LLQVEDQVVVATAVAVVEVDSLMAQGVLLLVDILLLWEMAVPL
jgi:hypothetical protein